MMEEERKSHIGRPTSPTEYDGGQHTDMLEGSVNGEELRQTTIN